VDKLTAAGVVNKRILALDSNLFTKTIITGDLNHCVCSCNGR